MVSSLPPSYLACYSIATLSLDGIILSNWLNPKHFEFSGDSLIGSSMLDLTDPIKFKDLIKRLIQVKRLKNQWLNWTEGTISNWYCADYELINTESGSAVRVFCHLIQPEPPIGQNENAPENPPMSDLNTAQRLVFWWILRLAKLPDCHSLCRWLSCVDDEESAIALCQWLEKIQEIDKAQLEMKGGWLNARFGDQWDAEHAYANRHLLQGSTVQGMRVIIGEKPYGEPWLNPPIIGVNSRTPTIMTQSTVTSQSDWVRTHSGLWLSLPGTVIVHSADSSSGYKILEAKSDPPGRLNEKSRPGNPLATLPESIYLPRQYAIERLIETGEAQHFEWTHRWTDKMGNTSDWVLQAKCCFPDEGKSEIACFVDDGGSLENRMKQKNYWLLAANN